MLYPDETVHLVRAVPNLDFQPGAEGKIKQIIRDDEGRITEIEARFYVPSGSVDAVVPYDAVELAISQATQDRTAVIWGIDLPPQDLFARAMHSLMDRGFLMREGLNVARLHYDRDDRWWKWGELIADSIGAQVVTSAHLWDGCVAGFSGVQRFQLEFRLKGRGQACLLLHEREAAYAEQERTTHAAMHLVRILTNLYDAIGGHFCAFPVADAWLMDEDWESLLRSPHYPDFFLTPADSVPRELPDWFRVNRLTNGRVLMTVLPIKFAPTDDSIERTDRELMVERLRKCQSLGEKYYDQMYHCRRLGLTGIYSNAKDAYYDAISLANELGLKEHAVKLEERLHHIKSVFRSQFS